MPKKTKRKSYSIEFKEEAVRLVNQRGSRSVADIAASLGVAENMLHRWKREYDPERTNDRGESPEQEPWNGHLEGRSATGRNSSSNSKIG